MSRRSGKGSHTWSHALCESTYNAWAKQHHHATRSQKKAEANMLHKTHGCGPGPGSYKATITAHDADGTSSAVTLSFTIVA